VRCAALVNIAIMRAFVHLRHALATHEELRKTIEQMERRYDSKFEVVLTANKQIREFPTRSKPRIGFHASQHDLKMANRCNRLVN